VSAAIALGLVIGILAAGVSPRAFAKLDAATCLRLALVSFAVLTLLCLVF
jgi:hypothetical protein